MSVRVTGSTTIDAPQQLVHRVILAIEDYPTWAGGIREARVDARDEQQRPLEATIVVQTSLAQVSCTLAYEHADNVVRWRLVRGEIVSRFDGEYRLEPQAGATKVSCDMEVGVDLPLPRMMLENTANDLLERALAGLRTRVAELSTSTDRGGDDGA